VDWLRHLNIVIETSPAVVKITDALERIISIAAHRNIVEMMVIVVMVVTSLELHGSQENIQTFVNSTCKWMF